MPSSSISRIVSRYSSVASCISANGADLLGLAGLDLNGLDEQLGGKADREAQEQAPHEHVLVPELETDLHELDHNVEDRTGRERKKRHVHEVVHEGLADERAEEGRAAADD